MRLRNLAGAQTDEAAPAFRRATPGRRNGTPLPRGTREEIAAAITRARGESQERGGSRAAGGPDQPTS
jgi:hypothetical protein